MFFEKTVETRITDGHEGQKSTNDFPSKCVKKFPVAAWKCSSKCESLAWELVSSIYAFVTLLLHHACVQVSLTSSQRREENISRFPSMSISPPNDDNTWRCFAACWKGFEFYGITDNGRTHQRHVTSKCFACAEAGQQQNQPNVSIHRCNFNAIKSIFSQ